MLRSKGSGRERPVLGRWVGLETEYAVRHGLPALPPSRRQLFYRVREILQSWVATRPGRGMRQKEAFFTQNGGAICYEHLPHCPQGGLIEGATPECVGPTQLLLYQRAQDHLLCRGLAEVERRFRYHNGLPSVAEDPAGAGLGLLKNCRDADGNRYGAQENYDADVARGPGLWLFRLALLPLCLWAALWTVVAWVAQAVIIVSLVGYFLAGHVLAAVAPTTRRFKWVADIAALDDDNDGLEKKLGGFVLALSYGLSYPVAGPYLLLLQLFAFRDVRRDGMAFLVSRPLISGAGTVEPDGRFGLSEKGPVTGRIMRWTLKPTDRCILDPGNLLKILLLGMDFRRVDVAKVFRRRQRMQLGLSDSNLAQVAELLKVGTTSLVLDMVEDGFLRDAPRLVDPIAALQAFVDDPTLEAIAVDRLGKSWTALELQRWYAGRAEVYLRQVDTPSMEAFHVLKLWREVLADLEARRFEALVGRLDWVTKRALLEECGATGTPAVLKTLDLRYHELGNGYFARLEREGLAPRLVSDAEIRRAVRQPPDGSPAQLRGAFIRDLQGSPTSMTVSWDSAHLGSRLRPKVVPFRAPRRPSS